MAGNHNHEYDDEEEERGSQSQHQSRERAAVSVDESSSTSNNEGGKKGDSSPPPPPPLSSGNSSGSASSSQMQGASSSSSSRQAHASSSGSSSGNQGSVQDGDANAIFDSEVKSFIDSEAAKLSAKAMGGAFRALAELRAATTPGEQPSPVVAPPPSTAPLPPLPVKSTMKWVITDYSAKRHDRAPMYSPPHVDARGCMWRFIFYPNGEKSDNWISLFIEVPDAETLPFGWRRTASFTITLVNRSAKGKSFNRSDAHEFKSVGGDVSWGWPHFIECDKVQTDGFLDNDTLEVTADICLESTSNTIDDKDLCGYLCAACAVGYENNVKMCLERNAPINELHKGNAPIHSVCMATESHPRVLEMLLAADADINLVNGDNESGLLLAAYYGHTDLVKILLDRGALTDVGPSKNGLCALGAAAQQGEVSASKQLIKHGAPLCGMGIGCCAPLKQALQLKRWDCALVLVEAGCPVIPPTNSDEDYLLFAARHGTSKVVAALLDHGADANVCDKNGDTPLSILIERNMTSVGLRLVRNHNASILRCSRDRKKVQRAKLLLTLEQKKQAKKAGSAGSAGKHGSVDEATRKAMEAEKLAMELMAEEQAEEDKKKKAARKKKSKKDKKRAAREAKRNEEIRKEEERRLQKEAEERKREEDEERRRKEKEAKAKEEMRLKMEAEAAIAKQLHEAKLEKQRKLEAERAEKARKEKEKAEAARRKAKLEAQKAANLAQTFPGKVTKVFGGSHGYCFVNYKVYCARSVVEKTMMWPPKDGDSVIVKAIRDPVRNNWKAVEFTLAKPRAAADSAANPPRPGSVSSKASGATTSPKLGKTTTPDVSPVSGPASAGLSPIHAAASLNQQSKSVPVVTLPSRVESSDPIASTMTYSPPERTLSSSSGTSLLSNPGVPIMNAKVDSSASNAVHGSRVLSASSHGPGAPLAAPPAATSSVLPGSYIQPMQHRSLSSSGVEMDRGSVPGSYIPFQAPTSTFGSSLGAQTTQLGFDRPPQNSRMLSAPAKLPGPDVNNPLSGLAAAQQQQQQQQQFAPPSGGYMGSLGAIGRAPGLVHRTSSGSGYIPGPPLAPETSGASAVPPAASSVGGSKRLSVFESLRTDLAADPSAAAGGVLSSSHVNGLGGGMDFLSDLALPSWTAGAAGSNASAPNASGGLASSDWSQHQGSAAGSAPRQTWHS